MGGKAGFGNPIVDPHDSHIGVPKQRKGGHIGVTRLLIPPEIELYFLCKNHFCFLLTKVDLWAELAKKQTLTYTRKHSL